jgi:hypothetical protein
MQEFLMESTFTYPRLARQTPTSNEATLSESLFDSMLTLEKLRAERSRKPFILMLLNANAEKRTAAGILKQAAEVVLVNKREIDLVGWYSEGSTLGVIFTEVNLEGDRPVPEILRAKIATALIKHLGWDQAAKINISLHVFPESLDRNQSDRVAESRLYPDLESNVPGERSPVAAARESEIADVAAMLFVLPPLIALIAAFLKLTSETP